MLPNVGAGHLGVVHLGGEDQVHVPRQQLLPQALIGGLLVELQAHIHPVGLGHIAHDDVRGELRQGGEARHDHGARVGVDVVGQLVDAGLQSGQRLLNVGQEQLAVLGQLHVAALFLKELHVQLALQLLDGVAQAGLADKQFFRRPGVVLQLGDGSEIIQLT